MDLGIKNKVALVCASSKGLESVRNGVSTRWCKCLYHSPNRGC